LSGREERGAGWGDLLAEGAVELRRVAARFVDLQRELRRVEDEGARAARAGRGLKELERLLADARRVAREVERGDELVAGAIDAAVVVHRPAARRDLVAVGDDELDAGAAADHPLSRAR